MSANPVFIGTVNNQGTEFDNADGTTALSVWTAGASGGVLEALQATNLSANPYALIVYFRKGGVNYHMQQVTIPANAGSDAATLPVNLLDPAVLPFVNAEPNRTIVFAASEGIYIAMTGALAGPDIVHVVALGGDY